MIDVLMHNHDAKELHQLSEESRSIAALLSEDEWNWFLFSEEQKALQCLEEAHELDFVCLDIAEGKGLLVAEKARSSNEQAFILLVADPHVSPMEYLRPSIMPGALLLRPFSDAQMKTVLREALEKLLQRQLERQSGGEAFRVDLKSGSKLIPFQQIYFFEARNKKIILNMGNREYSFYDTIDHLQDMLPQSFIRCHRSFLVARTKIDQIYLSKNYITLLNGMTIPLSRTYKSVLKELR